MALTDELTGLPNRRQCNQRLAEEAALAGRHVDRCFSVMVIDLNDFKRINDGYGHQVGDEVLRQVARLLVANLRSYDVCCRTGGDEFTVILPRTPLNDCNRVVARLRFAFDDSYRNRALPVGASIGVATFGVDAHSATALLDLADQRMYRNKRRNQLIARSSTNAPPNTTGPTSVAAA